MIHKVGGVNKFPVKKLIPYVKVSYAKYTAYLDAERARKQQRAALLALKAATQEKKTVLEGINSKIENCEHQIKAANDIIEDGNAKPRAALDVDGSKKRIERDVVQAAQSKIDIGLERKRKLENDLKELQKKKSKIL